MALQYPSGYDDDFINTIKEMIDHIKVHGKSIQDLVADGQLTDEQYGELLFYINGLVKKGEIDINHLSTYLRNEIEEIDNKINKGDVSISDLDGEVRNTLNKIENKLDKGDVSVSDINKNKGQFDETYFTDEVKQQWAGNTPVNATPADGGVTTEKLANKSATSEKRTKLGERSSIIPLSKVPEISKDPRFITFYGGFRVYAGKVQKLIASDVTLDLSGNDYHYIYFDFDNDSFVVLNLASEIPGLPEGAVHIATIVFDGLGNLRTVDIPCDYTIGGKLASRMPDGGRQEEEEIYYLQEDFPDKWYESPTINGYASTSDFLDNFTLEYVYQEFDNMLEDDDWATKQTLGSDESGSYTVHFYEFSPSTIYAENFTKKLPKIVLSSNIHGNEKMETIALLKAFKAIRENWESDPVLEWLRWNVHFIVIPVANPWGFVNHEKTNYNGVDLNRNFSFNWETDNDTTSSDPNSRYYKGSEPFSEVESRYIRYVIQNNLDALLYYDLHMNGSSELLFKDMYWTILKEFPQKKGYEEMKKIFIYAMNKMTRESHKRYSIPKTSGFIGNTTYTNPANSPSYAFDLGIPSATVECIRFLPHEGVSESYKSEIVTMNTEYMVNVLLESVRQLM